MALRSGYEFLRHSGGNVGIMFAFVFPVLLGAAGVAVDSASLYNQQSRMQSVADASALAVAKELHLYRKTADDLDKLKSAGKARVEALLAEAGLADRPHSTSLEIGLEQNEVDLTITMVGKILMPIAVSGENPIVVSSQASAYGQSRLCVLGLHSSSSDTIKAAAAQLTAPDCAVQSNSKDASGLVVSSGGKIVSTVICTSGGYSGGSDSFEPAPTSDCPALEDPLSSRQPPPVSGCDYLNRVIDSGKVSISPGTYCGGLKIGKTAQVTAEPGIYVLTGGSLKVSDSATLTGEYVSFYFHDDLSTLEFKSNTTIDLSAPKDGAMAGILFYENRAVLLGRTFLISSKNAHRLLGTIYLPRGLLKVDARGAVADLSAYTVIVTRQLEVASANLVVNSDYGGTDVPVPEGVGPNSRFVRVSE